MLKTPDQFVPLLTAAEHPSPLNFLFRGDELLVQAETLALPDEAALRTYALAGEAFHPIGLLEGRYSRTTALPREAEPPEGHAFRKLRSLFGQLPDGLVSVAGRAYQIAEWARTHRYCGACATPTDMVAGERCARCPACGMVAYPRISPAMMVLIKKGDAILLARHLNHPAQFFTALAGFVEAGESIEECVHREVFEEVGVRVRDVAYFGSQPWPFPHSLMLAFTAEYAGGEIRVDETEIAEAGWFGPGDAMPKVPPRGFSIAGELIQAHWPVKGGAE
ncbi:MAG: pyrophosphatase [Rhodoferax sp.]|nr:pyrophosphatase [Rhodoferax sp.]